MFRYPGGKSKLRGVILQYLKEKLSHEETEYREPFFGGGSIGLSFLAANPCVRHIWVNDKDTGIASLWTAVMDHPEELKKYVMTFQPSVAMFDEYKNFLLTNKTTLDISYDRDFFVDYAFKKLAVHQMSYSGLGTKSGGPLGGRSQESKYPIDCRWSPKYIAKQIDKHHNQFSEYNIRYGMCWNSDFENLIIDEKYPALIYLDPPYYVKGNELYQFGFSEADHERLALLLEKTNHLWLLSYDDCPEIRKLYSWANIVEIGVNYTIKGTRTKGELLISK